MAISDWPDDLRPRERLIARGPQSLTDAELLAIFLRTGVKGQSAVDLARSLIQRFGGLDALISASLDEFCSAPGVGMAKYAQLQAVVEMSRRHLQQQLQRKDVFESPEAVRRYLIQQLAGLEHECFAGLFLDTRHRLIEFEVLFRGTIDSASVHPREVVKRALSCNAAAIVVAHNHPSGDAQPSQSDIAITQRLKDALALVEVRLLDHFVATRGQVSSLAEMGHC